jgi:RNA polymerase sigma factor, sigma-70 family
MQQNQQKTVHPIVNKPPMEQLEFEKLLKDCRKHKQQAMMTLYEHCCNEVFNASFRIVCNEQDAEEITQDSFLKAFGEIGKFSGSEKSFVSFVKTIAINRSIDNYRKHKNDPILVPIENEPDVQDETEENAMKFTIEQVKKSMEMLSRGYKIVLSMHLLDNLDFYEIAQMLKIHPSTVRSQYVRAKNRLKELITDSQTTE